MSTRSSPYELDLLRGRVRLYLQVLLVIDLAAYASDLVTPLFISRPAINLTGPLLQLRWVVTGVLLAGWFAVPRTPRLPLMILESVATVVLAVFYGLLSTMIASEYDGASGPAFAVLGVVLLLVVRASLVPSPVQRTVAVGLTSFAAAVTVARADFLALGPTTLEGLLFMSGAFVTATAVTSHVIYGLRREVRNAMRLGQYALGRKLGEGGMGIVYQATHLMLRRPTAVKLLPPDRAGERTIARFEREVQQTSRLDHPNSVRIYDYGRTPDGQFYYAMEYLDGVTLAELVELDGPLEPRRVVHVLTAAARALAEAHALGLVHRDVKPANIMLCDRGRIPDTVKVLDFGLVKVTDESADGAGITQENAVLGTPHYLAPEALTDPEGVGPPSDVYALGAVAFFLLAGRHVFTGKTVVEVCGKHLHAAPEAPSEVRGEAIPADLEALVLACLAKAPEARPADGDALAEALEGLELRPWSTAEARDWWASFTARRGALGEVTQATPTQLAIDVHERG